MKEIYCVILQQGFLTARETVNVQADDIMVTEDGVKLFDGEQCVAFFTYDLFKGVYRKVDAKINFLPEGAKSEGDEDENVACEN